MLTESGTSNAYKPQVLFDSRNETYKTPFGAISTRRKVFLLFPVLASLNVKGVSMVLRRNDHNTILPLTKRGSNDGYDEFSLEFGVDREGTYYYRFELYTEQSVLFCGNDGSGKAIIGDWLPEWQLSVYTANYGTADFIKGGVVYQIFCDRFFHSGEYVAPRYGVSKKWHEDVTVVDPDGVYRANDFYGGNFKGIEEKLDYLQDLGVTALYLSPVFESSSNHRYDTADYSKLEPMLGTEDDFRSLIKTAEEKNIAIILDGVFNHTGADSVYFNKFGHYPGVGAYQSKESPYYSWYTFYDFPDDYRCWWGITVVPTIAHDAVGYQDMIASRTSGIIKKWTDFGVKGWRLDVVDELGSNFIERIRRSVKTAAPDGLVLGEVWEDASNKFSYGEERQYFYGDQLDGVMNYVYKEAILEFLGGGSAKKFADTVLAIMENYPEDSLNDCFTLIGSHDTVRAINALSGVKCDGLTKTERRDYKLAYEDYERGKRKLLAAACLQYFLPGVPCVYYGDEIGMQGFDDPINRRPFTWDAIDEEIHAHYAMLGKTRKKYKSEFIKRPQISYSEDAVSINRNKVTLTVHSNGEWKMEER